MGQILLAALVLVLAGLAIIYNSNSYSDPAPPVVALQVAAKVGSPAPDFTLTDAASGQPVTLSSFRGKPVWINFWATWCDACREEMPAMKQAYARYRDKGLVILGLDVQESAETVNAFTHSNGYDWTFLLDKDGKVTDKYFLSGVPTHWFIGTDGIIKATQVGAIPQADLEGYMARIMGQ